MLSYNINNDHNNNNDSKINLKQSTFIELRLQSIWKSLKSSTSRYESLSATENEIKQHFEQLHQYLINEEHRLKKDIINDKDTIINQIDKNINELKYLNSIIISINSNNKNNIINKDSNDFSDDHGSDSVVLDTTDQYSTITIMKSINTSSSLQSFIKDNNQTLFYRNNKQDTLLEQYNNNSLSSLILDMIFKYNNQFKVISPTNIIDENINEYHFSTKQPDLHKFNSLIMESIKLSKTSAKVVTTNNNDIKESYIITTNHSKGMTLINTSDNSTKEFNLDYDFCSTYSSIISVGEYLYIFGGRSNQSNWIKFSVKSKNYNVSKMEGVNPGSYISVCYDGQDHIYLANGDAKRIFRFNINTTKFEPYSPEIGDLRGRQVSTMIFQGKLYSIPYSSQTMFEFDLTTKTKLVHECLSFRTYTACHDSNGNFYIHSSDNRFIRFNVETKGITKLTPIPAKEGSVYLLYHRESSTSSCIYSFGGAGYGNFRYSIETDTCQAFFKDDTHQRYWSGSASINLN
ncbi:hypothetical protein PPL_08183 [Heterostelium album PN500]|uniref:Uncharacterized protein n=1 Tax=Heterostelium pallidum (strain ATCC 26659 / Pp 5 / PN500) TaxID=670386 RepID=D3BIU8_HETP5|nr:hypothetical protein PPL_08183 [Heterostelium album PN500]EFA78722.1 hypothetical protein PPL_08183 [Heterostelium album PN500]|eukprot:XP_020430846.1 hypothetical protein PPL_08183 [Heterostelium album PN500]